MTKEFPYVIQYRMDAERSNDNEKYKDVRKVTEYCDIESFSYTTEIARSSINEIPIT